MYIFTYLVIISKIKQSNKIFIFIYELKKKCIVNFNIQNKKYKI